MTVIWVKPDDADTSIADVVVAVIVGLFTAGALLSRKNNENKNGMDANSAKSGESCQREMRRRRRRRRDIIISGRRD